MLHLIIRSTFLGEALRAMAVVRGEIETGHTNLYISILYIYIICRNKLKTTTNHKTQVPATRYFLSHTQRSTRGETTIHRLLVCNNTPRAV